MANRLSRRSVRAYEAAFTAGDPLFEEPSDLEPLDGLDEPEEPVPVDELEVSLLLPPSPVEASPDLASPALPSPLFCPLRRPSERLSVR